MTAAKGGRIDALAAVFGLAATGCVAVALDALGLKELGVAVPFGAYFAGLAWWRLKGRPAELTSGEWRAEQVAALEERVAELEAAQHRVGELEDRLDFAERMLAQRAEARVLPGEDR